MYKFDPPFEYELKGTHSSYPYIVFSLSDFSLEDKDCIYAHYEFNKKVNKNSAWYDGNSSVIELVNACKEEWERREALAIKNRPVFVSRYQDKGIF